LASKLKIATEEFFGKKICNNLPQQAQDALLLSTVALPSRTTYLMSATLMIFWFKTRQLFFS
jgi:hypothetical protein